MKEMDSPIVLGIGSTSAAAVETPIKLLYKHLSVYVLTYINNKINNN